MASQKVGVYAETWRGEGRVALVPDTVRPILDLGLDVLVEAGAGRLAHFPDRGYIDAGARVVSRSELFDAADILLGIRRPNTDVMHRYRAGQALICLLQPLQIPFLIRRWADEGLTAIAADMVPRTLSRARHMDALTSQDQVVGYQAVLTAADAFGRCFPASVPVGGTGEPTQVLVLGAGAAGRQAAATAR
jgi:NAD(P) transhydrogenase subunit alpha